MRKLGMEELANISGGGFGGGELNEDDKARLSDLILEQKNRGNSLEELLWGMSLLGFSEESAAYVKANW